jgi:uncharacterized membrane protein
MELYTIFKLIHILATVAFLGNIYTGLFWMNRAHRSRDLSIINHTMQTIILSDKYFTVPGVVIILIGGIGAAIQHRLPMLRLGLIFWPIVLFSLSGIVFAWKVVPLQKKISILTKGDHDNFDWAKYVKLYNEWDLWGIIAIITPLAALAMMVLKLPASSILVK